MRHLSVKQKNILKKYAENGFLNLEDLGKDVINKLENINYYETFWQDAGRYLADEYMKKKQNDKAAFI